MTLQEIMDLTQYGIIGILIILMGLIRIPKLDINFWSLIARGLGRALNGEVLEQVEILNKKFEEHLQTEEVEKMREARQRILRFNDEILFQQRHSKEHFDEILEDIDMYEQYCLTHYEYKNNKAVLAINTIKTIYNECLKDHSFLVYEKKEE